jgi:hypothetical protein
MWVAVCRVKSAVKRLSRFTCLPQAANDRYADLARGYVPAMRPYRPMFMVVVHVGWQLSIAYSGRQWVTGSAVEGLFRWFLGRSPASERVCSRYLRCTLCLSLFFSVCTDLFYSFSVSPASSFFFFKLSSRLLFLSLCLRRVLNSSLKSSAKLPARASARNDHPSHRYRTSQPTLCSDVQVFFVRTHFFLFAQHANSIL